MKRVKFYIDLTIYLITCAGVLGWMYLFVAGWQRFGGAQ